MIVIDCLKCKGTGEQHYRRGVGATALDTCRKCKGYGKVKVRIENLVELK